MSKVRQRTQPLSCSRHKRNGRRAQAQAALPTMMSGLDGCLCANVTWAGSGEKEGESFHVCFSAAQCWRGTGAEQGSAWSASIYIYIYAVYCSSSPLVVSNLRCQECYHTTTFYFTVVHDYTYMYMIILISDGKSNAVLYVFFAPTYM